MHTYFLFFLFFLLFSFYFFNFLFFGLGPTQPTWAGLDPSGPARSLAQATDRANFTRKRA
jgi:hypothetical protein